MNRAISQGQAMRSMTGRSRVIHFMNASSLQVKGGLATRAQRTHSQPTTPWTLHLNGG
jgi:hypothetical protein